MSKKAKDPNTMQARLRYRYTDLMALSEYLERQAQKGWYLTSLETGTFTAGEKKIVRYCVEVIPEADSASDKWNDDFKELLTLCEDSGWTFVCHKNDVCVFMSENPRSPAINTDRAAKVDAICKAERRRSVFPWCMAGVSLLLMIVPLTLIGRMRPLALWTDFGACAVLEAMFLYAAVGSLVNVRRWLKLERDAEAAGWPVPYFDTEYVRKRNRRERIVAAIGLAAIVVSLSLRVCLM